MRATLYQFPSSEKIHQYLSSDRVLWNKVKGEDSLEDKIKLYIQRAIFDRIATHFSDKVLNDAELFLVLAIALADCTDYLFDDDALFYMRNVPQVLVKSCESLEKIKANL